MRHNDYQKALLLFFVSHAGEQEASPQEARPQRRPQRRSQRRTQRRTVINSVTTLSVLQIKFLTHAPASIAQIA